MEFYSASSLTQYLVGTHVPILRHMILIPSQLVLAFSP